MHVVNECEVIVSKWVLRHELSTNFKMFKGSAVFVLLEIG